MYYTKRSYWFWGCAASGCAAHEAVLEDKQRVMTAQVDAVSELVLVVQYLELVVIQYGAVSRAERVRQNR